MESASHPLRRRMLMIASRFPPALGPGAERLRQTARHLSRLGWEVDVVSRGEPPCITGGGPHERPHGKARVFRVPDVDPSGSALRGLKAFDLFRFLWRPLGVSRMRIFRGLRWRCERMQHRFSIPDAGVLRVQAVAGLARRLHRLARYDLLFASGMPFSDLVIAGCVATTLRIPWIAEFRDPWVEYAHAPMWRSRWGRRVTQRLEAWVVRRARFVICVSEEMTQRMRERYPGLPATKFMTVLNGFDAAELEEAFGSRSRAPAVVDASDGIPPVLESILGSGRMVLLHAGSLYGGRTPEPLLEALRRAIESGRIPAESIWMVFAGRPGPFAAAIRAARRRLPVFDAGELLHAAALRAMHRATANVLLLAGGRGAEGDLSSKVFEYLAAGRPMLALTPGDGAATKFLAGREGIWHAEPAEPAAISETLATMFDAWRAGTMKSPGDHTRLRKFTREYQTRRLAAACRTALDGRLRRPAAASTRVEMGMEAT